ncbi:MAG: NADH-quinone oxidoreductase subunit NuoE [Ignavibacteriae bacterium HGW-Ignavibacteriae-1]|jgi:NADH:ubiquinone oxidoreductase subunit E|nr:NADH-quinone oxidoreductase subunit NuoE [Candidatus Kapabacteria bacterium]PKL86560.1 MAG: NADH-quinone oxidoreductase subunit NuoE [Ignavibacteriae bacterium HGW-Ignavibacteriae-1]
MCTNKKYTLSDEIVDYINECLVKEHPESYLIAILHKVQGIYGFLSEIHLDEVAHLLQVPTANVYGVATFYHYFRLKPRGQFAISVCMGTACFVKGADSVLTSFKSELGIDMGETTSDGLFSLEGTRCIGVCALAPVVTINDRVYSNVVSQQVSQILNEIKAAERV